MGKRWTEEEKHFLIKNYYKGVEYCMKKLNRSYNSIVSQACILGIKTNYRRKLTQKEAKKEFLKYGFKMIGKYNGAKKPIKLQCPFCNKVFNTTCLSSIKTKNTKSCGCYKIQKSKEKRIDLTNQIINKCYIIKYLYTKKNQPVYEVKCHCGETFECRGSNLKSGITTSCGCNNLKKIIERTRAKLQGKIFNNCKIIKYLYSDKHKNAVWKIKCFCGNIFQKTSVEILKRKDRLSCGCSKTISSLEDKIKKTLLSLGLKTNKDFLHRTRKFKELKGLGNRPLEFDFYLPKQKICIEAQGSQHYSPKFGFGSKKRAIDNFKITINHDKRKKQFALDNNIPLQIIPYTYFDQIKEIVTKLVETGELTEVIEPEIQK